MNPLENFYELVDVLKEGKNGKVFLVYDKTEKQMCVLKERSSKSASLYKRLKTLKNPYLPEIYRAMEFDGKLFVVEEFVEGHTLSEILTYNNGLDEKNSARILKEICNGLKILHEEKIIHRDLKPSNIMVTKNNSIKLIDFSISRISKENLESDTDFLGTRGYAPPEQFGFGQTDPRSDIYSLGKTFQKILGDSYNGYLKKILSKCTELDPKNRYQSVEEISADIDKKYWQYKLKIFSARVLLTVGIFFSAFFIYKNISVEKNSETIPKVGEKSVQEEISHEKISDEKPITKNFEWTEIKYPENTSAVEKNFEPLQKNFELPQSPNVESEANFDRVNCKLLLNGNVYEYGDGEIPVEIWKNWRHDRENIFYLPQNFFLSLEIENKTSISKNIFVQIDLNGDEKILHEIISAGQSKNIEIPLGNLKLINGMFDAEIWLRDEKDELIGGGNQSIRFYLLDFNEWRNAFLITSLGGIIAFFIFGVTAYNKKKDGIKIMNRIRYGSDKFTDDELNKFIENKSIGEFERIGYMAAFADRYPPRKNLVVDR